MSNAWLISFSLLFITILIPFIHYKKCHFHYSNYEIPEMFSSMPQITIILPMKNEEINASRKINEILSMDYDHKKIQLLVVISQSLDNTEKVVREILSQSSVELNWRVINDNLSNKSKSINESLKLINSDIFIMMDADSIAPQNSLLILTSWLEKPGIGAICASQNTNDNFHNKSYRTRFNKIRIGESRLDSTPIFEGSLSAYRISALKNRKLNPDINADDSQLSIISRSNGFKSLMIPNLSFHDTGSNSRIRGIRRAQGIFRVLLLNIGLCYGIKHYSSIMRNTIFFYIFFPWFFYISSLILILTSFERILTIGFSLDYPHFLLTLVFATISLFSPSVRGIIIGSSILIESQIRFLLGNKLNSWTPNAKKNK